jgi:2,4-dienoyl-CoA reductase-like NADH-dependent reductase (Old Yellow Enzyme family)
MPHLFEPLSLRGLQLPNRIGISPMCQYSAVDGHVTDWHQVHYGTRATGGAGLMIVEATAVVPEGRITPGDLGLWTDSQVEGLARIAAYSQSRGCVPAIQLAHAGRKASAPVAWEAQRTLGLEEGGWTTVAPSALAFSPAFATPQALDEAGIASVIGAFADAARRAHSAGFQAVEIHAAHGYLLHQFMSPLSNRRDDRWGGSFDKRTRLVREVVGAVRAVWPERLPISLRLSATDWVEGGWDIEQTVALCQVLKTLGVDLVDVSSGGTSPDAKIPVGPGYQVPFAQRIREETGLAVAAVGLITQVAQAEAIVAEGQADLVLLGREVLRNPYWPLQAAQALGEPAAYPLQYLRALPAGARAPERKKPA